MNFLELIWLIPFVPLAGAAVMLLFSFFWHASLPLLEVFVMRHTASRPGAYGRVRLWGSIGFIVAVTALGPVIDARGPWWALPANMVSRPWKWLLRLSWPVPYGSYPLLFCQPFYSKTKPAG